MPVRRKLPDRRLGRTFTFDHSTGVSAQRYYVTVGYYGDNETIGEMFLNTSQKAGSEADINASDAAVAISLALQFGVPLDTMREAMKRNADGSPMGPLAHALDIMAVAHLEDKTEQGNEDQ